MDEIQGYYFLTKKSFDFLAPVYNIMTLPLVRVRDLVVDFVNASTGCSVLDVATGTGQQAFAFAKHGCDVIGIDLIETMLEIAQKNNKGSIVKFEIADATHLKFNTNSFDISCISFALHDMPLSIQEQVLTEMVRVTKPNGIIVIVDYNLPQNRLSRAFIYRLITLYEGEYYKKFIVSDLDTLLRQNGIEVTQRASVLLGAGRILRGKIRK